MQEDGLWLLRKQRRTFHQPRLRRECFGELIQIDGSDHRWFEDRGPACTLLVFIDDAASTLMELRFVTSENTFDYRYSDISTLPTEKHVYLVATKISLFASPGLFDQAKFCCSFTLTRRYLLHSGELKKCA